MELQNMSAHDLERIEELKTTFGFEVVNAGFTCTPAQSERTVTLCYWRNKRGVRESAIFPNHEAAWRDALRVHEEATDAVKANPGVHRVQAMPAKVAAELSRLKKLLLLRGYTFSKEEMPDCDPLKFEHYSHYWKRNGMQVGMFKSHADAIRDAIKIWARDEPNDFCNSLNILGSGGEETAITPLTAEELKKLQGFPGFDDLPEEQKALTIQSEQLLRHLAQRGIKIDTSRIDGTLEDCSVSHKATLIDNPIPSVAFKAQGKSFEEVEEDQRNAKRAYGLVQGSAEEKKLRHLEAIGYEFFFTSSWGWKCKPDVNASGALETVVRAAWAIAVKQEGADKYDLLDAMGLPYIGSTVWAQNDPEKGYEAQGLEEERLVKVLAYDGMTAWLKLCSDMGEPQEVYTTARIEKIKIRGWKGNCDA